MVRFKRTKGLRLSPINGPESPEHVMHLPRGNQSCFSARDRPTLLAQIFKLDTSNALSSDSDPGSFVQCHEPSKTSPN
jgi:hypothetical protein